MKNGHSACLTNALSEEPENDPLCHRMMETNYNDSRQSAAMLAESSGRRFLGPDCHQQKILLQIQQRLGNGSAAFAGALQHH